MQFDEFFFLDLAQTSIDGIMLGSVYALMAIGFSLIWGVLGILNLAHGQTVAFGMFAGMISATTLNLPAPVAFVAAVITGILISLIIERICYRPIRRAHELVPMIATLGFWIATEEALQKVYFHLYFHDYTKFPNPYTLIGFDVGDFRIRFDYVLTSLVAAILVAILYFVLYRTRLGLALRMVAAGHDIAHLMGVNVFQTLRRSFMIAGAFGGAAGFLLGLVANMANPYAGSVATVKGLFTMILGGAGSLPGAIIGGMVLGFMELQSAFLVSFSYRDAIAMGLLFLILVFRPQGLFGAKVEDKI
ncbi:MAG: branched-chain amino acid ABC transporter permease [Gammaproteobacteria bacterium]